MDCTHSPSSRNSYGIPWIFTDTKCRFYATGFIDSPIRDLCIRWTTRRKGSAFGSTMGTAPNKDAGVGQDFGRTFEFLGFCLLLEGANRWGDRCWHRSMLGLMLMTKGCGVSCRHGRLGTKRSEARRVEKDVAPAIRRVR